MRVRQRRGLRRAVGQGHVLPVVVTQHEGGHLVGHRGQQLVPLILRQIAGGDDPVEQDLDVHLVVGGVDPGGVVDGVGVDPAVLGALLRHAVDDHRHGAHARAGVGDAAPLGEAEVAALPHARRREAAEPSTRIASLALSPTSALVSLEAFTYVPIPPFQSRSTSRGEDRAHQFLRRHLRDRWARCPAATRTSGVIGIDFAERGYTPPPGEMQARVVVRPGGAGQREQPLPLGERDRGVRVGIEEHVPVVEGRDEADVPGQQHPVAEHVAGHVADPDAGEVLGLAVDPALAEVALDGLPRAARGDAHRLVVVADRPAGGERVPEPEPALEADRVRDVGEARGALVRRDDEVGVVRVVAHHVGRRHDPTLDQVVGDVEERGDERAVAGHALGAKASRSSAAGGRLTTKPPLAPTGTMTAFFTICAFTRPSTSVRKSSRRSDQRSPPRATGPNRRCTPSTRGEYTQISNRGRGAGRSGISRGSSLKARYGIGPPSGPARSSWSAASP